MPEVTAMQEGGAMVFPQDLIDEIESLLSEFEVKASPGLRAAIGAAKYVIIP